MRSGRIRTIICGKRFEQEMAIINRNVRRTDEFVEGAETILSREPECGFPLEKSSVWFMAGHIIDPAIYTRSMRTTFICFLYKKLFYLSCEGEP